MEDPALNRFKLFLSLAPRNFRFRHPEHTRHRLPWLSFEGIASRDQRPPTGLFRVELKPLRHHSSYGTGGLVDHDSFADNIIRCPQLLFPERVSEYESAGIIQIGGAEGAPNRCAHS